MLKRTLILITIFFISAANGSFAESVKNVSFSPNLSDNFIKIIKFDAENKDTNTISISNANMLSKYINATDKFTQCNITSAYKDFNDIIDLQQNEDFTYLGLSYRLSNLGLFSLAKLSMSKIQDKKLWEKQIGSIRDIYFPKYNLSYDEEIYLAQMYSDIYFNNLAFETVKELSKNDKLLKKSDYANYVLACAYFESKQFSKALSHLNKAISSNPTCTNYLKMKVQLLCDTKQFGDALKIVDSLIAKEHTAMNYQNSLLTLKEYTLARFYKDEVRSKYHLATYLTLNSDYGRAVRELNTVIAKKKKEYKSITLVGDIHYKTSDYTKALDSYNRAYEVNKKYPQTLVGIANINFYSSNYKKALEYYGEALKKDKTNEEALINSALTYKMMSQEDKAWELLNKAVELNENSYKAYYAMSLIFEDKKQEFLNSTLAINPLYVDAWLDFALLSIDNKDYPKAQAMLNNAKSLDENNYKYYYYQGLLDKNVDEVAKAMLNFKKANKLNPKFEPAQRELSAINNI